MRRPLVPFWAALLAVVISAASAGGASGAAAPGDPGLFLNILPAGQGTSASLSTGYPAQDPPHTTDQLDMYRSLPVSNLGSLTDGDLTRYFKSETFVSPSGAGIERTEQPTARVTILRDHYGVPHIYGDTRADAMFGAGYVTAEDRLFLTDVLRHYGRGRLSEFLGPSQADLDMDRAIYEVAGYSEQELQDQVDRLPTKFGPLGQQVVDDGTAFIDGMNARVHEDIANSTEMPEEYPALQLVPQDWKPTDLVAVATLIQAIFASGGGGELQNALFQQAAKAKLGSAKAKNLYQDLRSAEDPEAQVTADATFKYMGPAPVDPAAVAMPDSGSVQGYDPIMTTPPSGSSAGSSSLLALDPLAFLQNRLEQLGIRFPGAMSNWLAATASKATAGHPVAVMGPQVSYFSPEILMETDLHAPAAGSTPGLDARGATFPGLSLYVLLGRGRNFAWSATSGESDLVDVRAEKLCQPDGSRPTTDSTSYLFNGACVPMTTRTDQWVAKPTAGGTGAPTLVEAHVRRTRHGPVFATGTVNGAPVAFVGQRSTFGGELDSAVSFVLLNSNQVTGPSSFIDAMSKLTGSFNWLYTDALHIAYYHSGLYPVRAKGVDPDLPSWGTGRWEWQGFVSAAAHPQALDPSKGWIDSWNNKPAHGWRAADGQWGYGSIHRVQMLTSRLEARVPSGQVSPSDLVRIMADAATVDLRGQEDLPWVLKAIGDDPQDAPYLQIMKDWVATGAHRVDRNGDGQYDDQAAVALMDEWWSRMIYAAFDPTLSGLYGNIPLSIDDTNRTSHLGSSFQTGYYGYVQKAVRMALGVPVSGAYAVLRCADGTLAGCRAALIQSLRDSVNALGPNASTWNADEQDETIHFEAVGLVSVPDIPWQNRPTFQQVVQVTS
jgi:acyl-homoserine lactone acylase PvdQ